MYWGSSELYENGVLRLIVGFWQRLREQFVAERVLHLFLSLEDFGLEPPVVLAGEWQLGKLVRNILSRMVPVR